jgi:hypothetical protein
MKKIILFISFFAVNIMFGQSINLKELINLVEMNNDEFDTFCVKKGYELYLLNSNDSNDQISYFVNENKGDFSSNYLSKFNYKEKNRIMVSYQTIKSNYILIKNEIKLNGFIFLENQIIDETYYLEYKKNNLELSLVTFKAKNKVNIENTVYEISIAVTKN